MNTALAVAFALLGACVAGRREQIKFHDGSGKYPDEVKDNLADTLDRLYKTFSSRAKSGKNAADSIVFNIQRLAKNAQYGDGTKMEESGWNIMIDQIGLKPQNELEETAMKEAWTYLSEGDLHGGRKIDPFDASQKITNGKMSTVRENVLKSIYATVAGGGNELTAEQLTCCKSPNDLIAAMGGAPVTFAKFKAYYNKLGMFISSDDQFVLMLVNAWHYMEPPYDQVNTVNLRMRCYVDAADDTGVYLTLINDCQQGELVDLIEKQTGTKYYKCEY